MKDLQERFAKFAENYLGENPDALVFCLNYVAYAHMIDDIIDEDIPPDMHRKQFIMQTFRIAPVLFANIFYLNNFSTLYGLVKMAHDSYVESLTYESSNEEWKQRLGDFLRQNGNEVILACIEIVGGSVKKIQAAVELRELAYETHHTPEGKPC